MKYTAKRSLRVAIALLVCLVMMSSFFAPVFAWYINKLSTKVEIESGIIGSYFEQGNGTEDMPYVIARPIQLYYFAWLQNLGYFDGNNPSSTTSNKKFYFTLSTDIDMSENPEYQVLPPIGTPDHPFVGVFNGQYHYQEYKDGNPVADKLDPNNTVEGTYHVIKNLKISNDDLSNIPQSGTEGQQYIGLFGVIGSMSNPTDTGTVKNFGLYNAIIETKDPTDNRTIIGIVAGYCNGILEGIGVSDCRVKVKNGVSPASLTAHNTNPDTGEVTSKTVTPETLSFSLVGFSDTTYQAYNISPIAGGDEFGGSLAMESIYNKITAARDNPNANRLSYNINKVVEIDPDGVETVTYSNPFEIDYHRDFTYASSQSPHNMFYYLSEYEQLDDGDVTESYSLVERYSGSNTMVLTDGVGNYLQGYYSNNTYSLRNTTDLNSATKWTVSYSSGNWTLSASINNSTRYLRYNNGLALGTSSDSNRTWTITTTDANYQDFRIKSTAGNYYINFDNGWQATNSNSTINVVRFPGSAVTQYTYLNGGKTLEKKQAVTTITRTRYDAYYIQDGSGNYLVAQAQAGGSITNTSSTSNATAWRFSNGANGGTFSIQSDDEVIYYLRNNNGTLEISTTSTSWTVSNGQITNGGYYLVYLDGNWKLLQETTYYTIGDGNGHYLNYSGSAIIGGSSATTRWHIDANNKIYTYNGTTKTYLYNNNGTLTTTTTVGTASAFTIDNANHVITTSNRYLCYNDDAWSLKEEVGYYLINDGAGHYLNFSGSSVATGTSSNATRWYFVGDKIYAYNGTTKYYLRNNNGALETTTTTASASTFVIDTANNFITTGNYYLSYNNGAWGLIEEPGYYTIADGDSHYLNFSNGSVDVGTSLNASHWYFVDGKLYAYNGTTKTYLYNNGGVLSTTTAAGSASTWTIANGNITTGDYHLIYQNGWQITTETTYTLISDGSVNYFNLTSSGYDTGTSSDATQWHNDSGKLYTYINGAKTYVVNNGGSLATTTTAGSATTFTVSANSITSGGYSLAYQNGWLLTNETSYYLISDGSGNYFNLTSSGYETGVSSNATAWHFSNGASGGKIYAYVNGTKTYMQNSTGTLGTTTTEGSATNWTVSSGQISNGGYNLVYSGGWLLTNVSSYYTLSDEEGHYLNLTSSGYSVGTSSNATAWQMTSENSGKIYTYINGTATYLYRNGGSLSTTTNSGTATTWDIDNTAKTISNSGYYLKYDGDNWILTNTLEYYILDGNGHYLNLNASTYLTEVGTSSNATEWIFTTSGNNYYISTDVNGTPYYLNYDNGNMVPDTTRSTTWTVSGSKIYCTDNSIEYDMFYDGVCWTIVESTLDEYYIISDGTNYMGTNETTTSSWWGDETTYSIINQTVRSYAAKFTFASGVLTTTGGAITTNINGTTRYLYRSGNSSTTVSLNGSQGSYSNWVYTNSGGHQRISARRSSTRYYYIRYNNGWTSLSSSQNSSTSNTYVLDGTAHIDDCSTKTAVRELPKMVGYSNGSYNFTNTIASNNYDLTISISNNNYNLTANASYAAFNRTANVNFTNFSLSANAVSSQYDITNQTESTTTIWKNTVETIETVQVKGKETYIPLSTDDNGVTSLRNTGYIVSGSNYSNLDTYSGDIRVSYYAMSNLYRALGYSSNSGVSYNSSRLEIVTRNYLSNGFVRISDSHNANNSNVNSDLSSAFPNKRYFGDNGTNTCLKLDKYEESREQLDDTLSGASNVYGLHFMDAQININNLVNIGKATINGSTYYDYKMPQDCIDFNLNTRGSINFYAGTYFGGNTAFFSFHHIVRNEGEIVSIDEIDKIYGDPTNTAKSYIYKYVGGSTPTLPSGYVLMFDTDWIKNPTMVEYAMYYFEIPVNAGEYALGSVNGADGAYLIYLDIGASSQSLADGTTLETSIKGIDFVTYSSLSANSIATTLTAIDSSTSSSAVIMLKNRFQGDIIFNIQIVTVQGVQVKRITYTLTDTSAKDYVLWTKSDTGVEVVDGTVYT